MQKYNLSNEPHILRIMLIDILFLITLNSKLLNLLQSLVVAQK